MRLPNVISSTLSPTEPTMLVVASGKAATGASLVSALLALALAGEGRQVLLVDGTAHGGALRRMLGVAPRPATAEPQDVPPDAPCGALADAAADVDAQLVPVTETLVLLPGDGPRTAAERERLFGAVRARLHQFDLVVVDAGSRLDAVLAACAGGASRLLLVATDEPVALAATHALLKAATAQLGAIPADVVVNRCAGEGAAEIFAPLADAARRFLDRPLSYAGAVPHDPCLQGGVAAGMALQDAASGSPCALAARDIGLRLAHDPELHAATGGARLLAWQA